MPPKTQSKTQIPTKQSKQSRDRKIHIDFRPEHRPITTATKRGLAYFLITLVLLFNISWYAWKWIQPWDRSAQIERSFAKAEPENISRMTFELLSLGEPGRATLLNAMANPRPEVRQAARIVWWRTVTEWREDPRKQPADAAKLFNDLPGVLENIAPEEREQLRSWVDQWLELKLPGTKETQALQSKSREHILDLTRRPPLRGLTATQIAMEANRQAVVPAQFQIPEPQTPVANSNSAASLEQSPNQGNFAQSNAPQLLQPNDTRTIQRLPLPRVEPTIPVNDPASSDLANSNQNERSVSHFTPLLPVVAIAPVQQIGTSRTREVLAEQANAGWEQIRVVLGDSRFIDDVRRADQLRLNQMHVELRSHGWNRSDLELFDAFASKDLELLQKTINDLPERIDIRTSDWLRGFALHSSPIVRRAAYSWLVTSRGQEIKQWLAERINAEQDGPTREWLSNAIETSERRATNKSAARR